MFENVLVAWLVAYNGRSCPCRIKVKSTGAQILKKSHIEGIASSLGKTMFLSNSEVLMK